MEQNEQTYNGWKNYETWVTALWLDNDQASHAYWRDAAEQCRGWAPECEEVKEGLFGVAEMERFLLASQLKEQVSDAHPLADEATLYADLLNAALADVDWNEIAEHYLDGE